MKVRFAPSPTGSVHIGNTPGAEDAILGPDSKKLARRAAGTLVEARAPADAVLTPASDKVSLAEGERETLERFRELRAPANGGLDAVAAKAILRELKAVGGNLRTVRRALTGRDSGPELWAVIAALPREETLRRIDAAL